ncbi:MAG: hypothetical protein WBI60_05535, partial [Defluviitoga tunisiensis]
MKYFNLAVDLGASGGKVFAGTLQNDKLVLQEVNRFPNNVVEINGVSFWDILYLYNNILNSVNIAQERGLEVLSLGIDSWGVDFGLLNKNRFLINNPIHYRNM